MKNIRIKAALAGVLALTLSAGGALAASAAPTPAPSLDPMWLWNPEETIVQSTDVKAWDDPVYGYPLDAGFTDYDDMFTGPADAANVFTFFSNPGDELDSTKWLGSGFSGFNDPALKTVLTPALRPIDIDGLGMAAAKANGGIYSVGIAFTDQAGVLVKGVSFVRLSRDGKLLFVRDIPEPSAKPGAVALRLITVLSSLLRRFPGALASAARSAGALPLLPAPPSRMDLPSLPSWLSPSLWIGFTSYLFLLILGKELPGQPVYEIQAVTLQAIADQSLSFFYVLPALSLADIVPQSSVPFVHPTELALFNTVEAWTLLFLPLLAADARAVSLPLLPSWASQMFATNLVLLPWCAVRAGQPSLVDADAINARRLPAAAEAAIGAVGLAIGAASVAWFALAPVSPDASVEAAASLSERWEHLLSVASTDRLTLAFLVDMSLYSLVQPWLIGDERRFIELTQPEAKLTLDLRFVPLFGAAHWLLTKPRNVV
jgi:hypothetical protein